MALSEAEVRALAAQHWRGKDVDMAVEIARIESRFNPSAYNGVGVDRSYGLMQINMKDDASTNYLGTARRKQFGIANNEALWDPATNMRAAAMVYQQNGNSFFGSKAWSTSAIAAAAIVGVRNGPGGGATGGTGTTDPMSEEDWEVWRAMTDEEREFYEDTPMNASPVPRAPGVTDREHLAATHWLQRASGGLGELSTVGEILPNPLEWAEALKKLLNIILSATFWKRLGIGVLGALVIAVALALYLKDEVT